MQQFAELWFADHTCIFLNNSSFFLLGLVFRSESGARSRSRMFFKGRIWIGNKSCPIHNAVLNFAQWIIEFAGTTSGLWTRQACSKMREPAKSLLTRSRPIMCTLCTVLSIRIRSGVTLFWTEVLQTWAYRAPIMPNGVYAVQKLYRIILLSKKLLGMMRIRVSFNLYL